MMIDEKLLNTRQELLNAVKSLNATPQIKFVLTSQIKKLNLGKLYHIWINEDYPDEGFHYLIVDTIKSGVLKILKNADPHEICDLIVNLVFDTI